VKKTLFTVMAIVMAIAMMGSAFAYFTDVENSTGNTMSAGTLDMQIANAGGPYGDTAVTGTFNSPPGLAPGDSWTTNGVYFKNVGTIPIHWVWARFGNLVEANGVQTDPETAIAGATDISKNILLTDVYESYDGGATFIHTIFDTTLANVYLNAWISRGAPLTADGSISLKDLVVTANYGTGDNVTSMLLLNGLDPTPALAPGATGAVKMTFKLSELTTNQYQGDTATFDINFIAAQSGAYPDNLLGNSITEQLLGLGAPPYP
jgi:predicted ribosomally synthesized peptide with SipW-like signal peptide